MTPNTTFDNCTSASELAALIAQREADATREYDEAATRTKAAIESLKQTLRDIDGFRYRAKAAAIPDDVRTRLFDMRVQERIQAAEKAITNDDVPRLSALTPEAFKEALPAIHHYLAKRFAQQRGGQYDANNVGQNLPTPDSNKQAKKTKCGGIVFTSQSTYRWSGNSRYLYAFAPDGTFVFMTKANTTYGSYAGPVTDVPGFEKHTSCYDRYTRKNAEYDLDRLFPTVETDVVA